VLGLVFLFGDHSDSRRPSSQGKGDLQDLDPRSRTISHRALDFTPQALVARYLNPDRWSREPSSSFLFVLFLPSLYVADAPPPPPAKYEIPDSRLLTRSLTPSQG